MATHHPEIGQTLHGFIVTSLEPLPELNATLIRLVHQGTGARYLHLVTDDPNNLFAVIFRTPPGDSTGVAHILEHTTLCGSRNFPVRDPFFTMLKRSLNTFMNAMTSSDWTAYPFASQNRKDFANLLEVYLDAAFFPLLRERDFRQEGHRLEFADPADPNSPLVYKGVVYNEMKGAMASPASLLSRRLCGALYPSTCYRHNSGGDPAEIPSLTWEALRAFHAEFYHPSNAWFFSYGTFPLADHLKTVAALALDRFEARPVTSCVPAEDRLGAPRRVVETYPLDPAETTTGKSMVQVGWLTCDIADSFERLAMSLLASLLLGNPAAPLYKALLDAKLGGNLAPGCGYHDENRTTCFAVGLQATEPELTGEIEALILKTLEEVAAAGFPEERIEAVIHRLEFSHREVAGDNYPYPLSLLMRLLGPWLHSDDPLSPLRLDANLARLRQELEAGPFFENLIRRQFLDNPHRVTLTLHPDTTLQQREDEAVAAKLEAFRRKLSAKEKEGLLTAGRELQEAQEGSEDFSCLPTLHRDDIPPVETAVPVRPETVQDCTIDWFDQPTNGIGYFIAHLPTAAVPPDFIPLVPLFCSLLTQIGAAGYSYVEMAERMEAFTGGLTLGTEILEDPVDRGRFRGLVTVKGKALVRNSAQLFSLLADLGTAPDFTDLERLKTVLNQIRTNLDNSIAGAGHSYAARAAAGRLTPAGALRETWSGLTQIRRVRELAAKPAPELAEFASQMQVIAVALFNRRHLAAAMTGEARHFPDLSAALAPFLSALAVRPASPPAPLPFHPAPDRCGWATSVPVNYVARVYPGVVYTDPDTAPLMVLTRLLRAGYLHREIREKGGAYGGMASYDAEGGLLSLLSYRDPHLARTLGIFDAAAVWAAAGEFSSEDIDQAILAVFSDLDRPVSPGSRGSREFANLRQGLRPDLRQQLRERILAVDRPQLMAAAQTYLVSGRSQSAVAVVGGEEALRQANLELGGEGLQVERI